MLSLIRKEIYAELVELAGGVGADKEKIAADLKLMSQEMIRLCGAESRSHDLWVDPLPRLACSPAHPEVDGSTLVSAAMAAAATILRKKREAEDDAEVTPRRATMAGAPGPSEVPRTVASGPERQ